jgi:hypothetical protein
MSKCPGVPKPKMWIPKEFTQKRKDWFIDNKYQPLCNYLKKNETQSLLFKDAMFINMVKDILTVETNGLRIYFAAYPDASSPDFPSGFESVITLIFSPTIQNDENTFADRGDFYILNPDSDYQDISGKALAWINNYQSKQLKDVLNKLYSFEKSDTTSVWYEKNSIIELIAEMKCQGATGLRIHLGSYTDKDDDIASKPYNIKKEFLKRLILQFSLTQGTNFSDFEIEDVGGFWQRPDPPIEALDNGQLCPPTNCP